MDELVPVPFVKREYGWPYNPDEGLYHRIFFAGGEYKDVGICQGCGCDIESGETVCGDCSKWSGVWARQAADGLSGAVRQLLADLRELEFALRGLSVVKTGADAAGAPAARLCAGCGCEVGPGLSLCEECEAELMGAQGAVWP
ncbi:MAG: hypothetical protein RBS34_02645 [Desulfofustis sp.]|jgi:hypothetical protein|nr:hypothetical protein [Desulfofustis sp.]